MPRARASGLTTSIRPTPSTPHASEWQTATRSARIVLTRSLFFRVLILVGDGRYRIGIVMMPRDILFLPISVTFLVGVIMLDAAFKKAILAGVIVLARIRVIVRRMRM